MYKVIIAEDEMFVRLGIKMSADWGKLGMEVTADVENGQQALEVYEKIQPDIVIADIKMPVMDGLALIRKIREKDQRTRFIILSCLEEFNIIKEAISLGVSDYVLKLTMTQDDMEKVLEKVKKELIIMDKINQDQECKEDKKRFEEELKTYLYYHMEMGEKFKRRMEEQFLPSDKTLLMLVLEIDHYQESKRIFNDSYGEILISAMENILSELLMEENYILMKEEKGRFIIVLEDEKDAQLLSEHVERLINKIREVLNRCVKSTVSFGIGKKGEHYTDFYEMHYQCTQALERKYFYGLNKNQFWDCQSQEECKSLIQRKMKRMIQRMKRDEGTNRWLMAAMEGFCQHINPLTISRFFEHAINVEMCRILPEGQTRYLITEKFINKINESQILDEVLEIYEDCMKYLQGASGEHDNLSKSVKDIVNYINHHYIEDITLDQISKMVELSRTYVCGLFKKEMGINITNYIMNYRIEKAKELLRDTNLKSYEISEKVGFIDESYFSRTFKKVTGQSPNAYKKVVVKEFK